MPKNYTHDPIFTELVIFHHGGLISSFLWKMGQIITVLSKYVVKNGQNRISDVNFSDLLWRSNDLRSQFCQLLLLEIVNMNHQKNFQVSKWSPSAISRTYKITRFFTFSIWCSKVQGPLTATYRHIGGK